LIGIAAAAAAAAACVDAAVGIDAAVVGTKH
jgi:hypothetical protein